MPDSCCGGCRGRGSPGAVGLLAGRDTATRRGRTEWRDRGCHCAREAATDALQSALLAGAALLASEQLGTAERALELACEQLRSRRQFGRLLGSFQALRHRAADLWTDITGARAVARYAAASLADDTADTELAAHLAQAVCADVALDTAEACLQMMGGIGFTWEHPTQLPLKRAAASHALLGTPEQHRGRIAVLRGLTLASAF